jgi:phosphonoacetate hydrolase
VSLVLHHPDAAAAVRAIDHVIIVVFDGLRPDLVRADTMPNLHRFREQGTAFVQARSVFPSVTRVCTSSIATGAPPAVHGIVGNAFFHSGIGRHRLSRQPSPEEIVETF